MNLTVFDLIVIGKTAAKKLTEVREAIQDIGADIFIVTSLEEIACE